MELRFPLHHCIRPSQHWLSSHGSHIQMTHGHEAIAVSRVRSLQKYWSAMRYKHIIILYDDIKVTLKV
jgi:hypothetical protein